MQKGYIQNFKLPDQFPEAKFIAEIGCNHKGDFDLAKQMIVVAKTCGADYAKFQKRNNRELLTPEQYAAPYDNPNSYGKTYGEHREFLEFTVEQHADLKRYAEAHEIGYATSVWDLTSAKEIAALKPDFIKIPSACNNNLKMMEYLKNEYVGDVHVSIGMSTSGEVRALTELFADSPKRLVLYACTSGYPVPFEDVCMLEILRLREAFLETGKVAAIGFSGHHNGYAIDNFSLLLGATWVERHFTLDRAWKGSDHAASLEPGGFRRLTRDAKHISMAWNYKPSEILEIEQVQRKKLKYRTR